MFNFYPKTYRTISMTITMYSHVLQVRIQDFLEEGEFSSNISKFNMSKSSFGVPRGLHPPSPPLSSTHPGSATVLPVGEKSTNLIDHGD